MDKKAKNLFTDYGSEMTGFMTHMRKLTREECF